MNNNRRSNNKPMSNIEFFVWLVTPILVAILLTVTLGKSLYSSYQHYKAQDAYDTKMSLIKAECFLIKTESHPLYPSFFGDSYTYQCKNDLIREEKVLVVDEYIETRPVSKFLTN